jgi:hypothetical protein
MSRRSLREDGGDWTKEEGDGGSQSSSVNPGERQTAGTDSFFRLRDPSGERLRFTPRYLGDTTNALTGRRRGVTRWATKILTSCLVFRPDDDDPGDEAQNTEINIITI